MLPKVTTIAKAKLTNRAHNALMSECLPILLKIESDNQKFKDVLEAYQKAYAEEEKYFKVGRKNPYSEAIVQLAHKRQTTLTMLKVMVEGEAVAGYDCADAAQLLLERIQVFDSEKSGSITEQTSVVRNLLADLEAEAMQQALTETQTLFLYTELKVTNEKVSEALNQFRDYKRDVVPQALKDARLKMDEAFDEAGLRLQSLADLFGEPFVTALKSWNTRVEHFKLSQKLKAAHLKGEEEVDPKPEDKPQTDANGQPKPQPEGNPSTEGQGANPKPDDTNPKPEGTNPKPDGTAPTDPKPQPEDKPTGGSGIVTPVQPALEGQQATKLT